MPLSYVLAHSIDRLHTPAPALPTHLGYTLQLLSVLIGTRPGQQQQLPWPCVDDATSRSSASCMRLSAAAAVDVAPSADEGQRDKVVGMCLGLPVAAVVVAAAAAAAAEEEEEEEEEEKEVELLWLGVVRRAAAVAAFAAVAAVALMLV